MALTELKIKSLTPGKKDIWASDGLGLRLLLKPNGARYWRFNYRLQNKQKTLAIGVYPDVSLKQARLIRDEARLQIANGVDPAELKRVKKQQSLLEDARLFSQLAKLWWRHSNGTWTKDHSARVWKRLADNCFALLDTKPVEEITPRDIRDVIRQTEARGALDVASRVLQDVRRVFSYGVNEEWVKFNPASDLGKGSLKAYKTQHRPSMRNDELGSFLLELDEYGSRGRLLTKYAIQLLLYTFLRPGEIRGARWNEFDIDAAMWRIPKERMKMKTEHLVPLSHQTINLLEKIREITDQYELVFPSERSRKEPMSDNTMRRAIFKLGFDGNTEGHSKAVPHGFRANASSILNENGFNADAIERQLSHMERNDVRAAYIYHAQFLDIRKTMMQWWADYLDDRKIAAQKAQ